MDNPWWSSGAFGLAGGALAWLGSWLDARRRAAIERHAKLWDERRQLYACFITLCSRACMYKSNDDEIELYLCLAGIEMLSITSALVHKASVLCGRIHDLPDDRHTITPEEYCSLLTAIGDFTDDVRLELGIKKLPLPGSKP